MDLKYIFVLLTTIIIYTAVTNESFAQVTNYVEIPSGSSELPIDTETAVENNRTEMPIDECMEKNLCFTPWTLNINVGDKVIWANNDNAPHTVSDKAYLHNNVEEDDLIDSGILLSGDTFEYVFNNEGTFNYVCIIHPWMTGKISINR